MDDRGILYLIWGDNPRDRELQEKSIESIKKFNIPYTIREMDYRRGLLNKSDMYYFSPYENTLFLDNDTIVLADSLEFGFQMSDRHGIAVCHDRACELERWHIYKHIPEYNTGVIFFHKSPVTQGVFNRWEFLCNTNNHTYPIICGGNDQPLFGIACYEKAYNPYVLPETWNYRRYADNDTIFGNIKIWHTTKVLTKELETNLRSNHEWKFYNA